MFKYWKHLPPDIGTALAELRGDVSISQGEIAAKLGVNSSKISRVESGRFAPSNNILKAYIEAIGTRAARDYLRYLKIEWKFVPRPAYDHPNRMALYKAERYLQKVEDFLSEKEVSKLLTGQAQMYKQALQREAEYLSSTAHSLAFIGQIGVGKTTALCLLTGLVLPDKKASLMQKVVLEIAGGRTTICEVRVRSDSRLGITVEPLPEADISKLVEELCIGLLERSKSKGDQEPTVSEEIARALRNMSGVSRLPPKGPGDKPGTSNPLAELVQKFQTRESLISEFQSRLQLWQRTRRELWYEGATKSSAGLMWLKQTFKEINYGRIADVSLPRRINIHLPRKLFNFPPYELEVVDTKGVDQSAVRPDVKHWLDDQRALTILCSQFNGAPDVPMLGLIKHLVETGSDPAFRERGALLVLPRPGEALAAKDDSGESAHSDGAGYALKGEQVKAALQGFGLGHVPVYFFNASSDDPKPVLSALLKQLRLVRTRHARRVTEISQAVDTLFQDGERVRIEAAQQEVNKSLRIFVDQHHDLPPRKRRADDALLEAVRTAHPRTLWASTRRGGHWSNLDVYYYLGAGASTDARLRASAAFDGLAELVRNKLGDADLEPTHGFLKELQSNVVYWREKFFAAVRDAGARTFRKSLESATELWTTCEDLYGRGMPYRQDVADHIRDWFEDSDREALHTALENAIQRAWRDQVLAELEAVISMPDDASDDE